MLCPGDPCRLRSIPDHLVGRLRLPYTSLCGRKASTHSASQTALRPSPRRGRAPARQGSEAQPRRGSRWARSRRRKPRQRTAGPIATGPVQPSLISIGGGDLHFKASMRSIDSHTPAGAFLCPSSQPLAYPCPARESRFTRPSTPARRLHGHPVPYCLLSAFSVRFFAFTAPPSWRSVQRR
jgi:hypothetical protein